MGQANRTCGGWIVEAQGKTEEPTHRGEPGKRSLLKGGVLSAFGERDYAFLWSGALISNIGTWVQTAALLWLIHEVFKSNTWVGAVNMANFAPVLLLEPLAGSLADRYNRRWLIVVGQTVMMLGALALAITATFNPNNKAAIMITVTIIGIAFALNFPAWQAILPDMVPREDMLNAIALSAAQWNLARFIGPLLGALILFYFSAATAFYANAASFLFVIAAIFAIQSKRGVMPPTTEKIGRQVVEGWKYVWRRRWMVNLLIALAFISLFGFSYIVLIPALTTNVLHRGQGAYGILLGMTGLGAVIGAPLVTYLSRIFKERNIIKTSTLSLGVFLIALGLSNVYWLSCLISIGLGGGYLVTAAAANSVLQGASSREMRGRVVSLYIMVFIGVSAVGGQLIGYISDVRSTPFSLILSGFACIATGLVLITFPRLIRGAVIIHKEESFEPGLTAPPPE